MVLVDVPEGGLCEIANKNIVGSKTIENFLQCHNADPNTAIPLSVNYKDWQQYLHFLDVINGINSNNISDNNVKIGALVIIDYLDNLQQAIKRCKLYKDEIEHYVSHNSYDSHNHGVVKNILRSLINEYTQFIPNVVLSFDMLSDFEVILGCINSNYVSKPLPIEGVFNIVSSLYSSDIVKTYHDTVRRFKSMHIISDEYVDNIITKKFILQKCGFTSINNNSILYHGNNNYYDDSNYGTTMYKLVISGGGSVQFISRRIATHYQDIITYDIGHTNLIYCPSDKPHLNCWKSQVGGETSNIVYISCS